MPARISAYAARKTYASGLLDLALLLANVSQFKILLNLDKDKRDTQFAIVTSFVSVSFLLQIIVGFLLIYIGAHERRCSSRVVRRSAVQRPANFCNGGVDSVSTKKNYDRDDESVDEEERFDSHSKENGKLRNELKSVNDVGRHSKINTLVTCLIFSILVINIVISGLGLSSEEKTPVLDQS